jgi:hypothetical protein
VTLVEAPVVAEPHYDLSALTLDPPGVTLIEASRPTPPQYDLSSLSLDQPG